MSLALQLYRLQQIDSRLNQVTTRLSAIQALLENNAELQAARQILESARTEQHEAEKVLKTAEYTANSQRVKLEQVESSLYSGKIQNPKELQDLQNEIAALKRHLAILEDNQLEAMLAAEAANAKLAEAQEDLQVTHGKVIGENAALQTEQNSLQKESDNLNAQRLAVLPVISADVLELYDSLRQKRSGMAVSQVIENSCDTCGSSLTPGYAQSVRTSAQLVHCPMCGRILYSN
jgi:predicted  nucleic acid-binding Zn-ribbon protein